MRELIADTLIWFGGFFAVSVGLLFAARKLTQKSRRTETDFRKLKAETSSAESTFEDYGRFAAGLSELCFSLDDDNNKSLHTPILRTDLCAIKPVHDRITRLLIVVALGSLAGGIMWSLTAEPRSWGGTMIGLSFAILAAGIALWRNAGGASPPDDALIPPLSRRWADILELLALRWTAVEPHADAVRKAAAMIQAHDAPLASFVSQSVNTPFPESPFGKVMTRFQVSEWPETTAAQADWFLKTSCRARARIATALRHDAEHIGKRLKHVVWLCLAPSLYLVLLTPPAIEMMSFFSPHVEEPQGISAEDYFEMQQRETDSAAEAARQPTPAFPMEAESTR